LNDQQINLFRSRQTDDWATPSWLYDQLDTEFHFDFDPCPLNPQFDGLKVPWFGSIFVNPPYSQVGKFLAKAHQELRAGRAHTVIFLVFANTDTQWFHQYVYHKAEIRFLKGRIKFVAPGKKNCAMRPSMLAIFKSRMFRRDILGSPIENARSRTLNTII
jgi:phage N-6-adenine-methyltransferase